MRSEEITSEGVEEGEEGSGIFREACWYPGRHIFRTSYVIYTEKELPAFLSYCLVTSQECHAVEEVTV